VILKQLNKSLTHHPGGPKNTYRDLRHLADSLFFPALPESKCFYFLYHSELQFACESAAQGYRRPEFQPNALSAACFSAITGIGQGTKMALPQQVL
jgi:hypothetical protein